MKFDDVIGLVDLNEFSDINLYVDDQELFKELVDLYVLDNMKFKYKNIVRGSVWFDDLKFGTLPILGQMNIRGVGNNTLNESNLTIYV